MASSVADEIEKLYGMYEKDILTKEEFQEAKKAALAKHKAGAEALTTPAPAAAVVTSPPPPVSQSPATTVAPQVPLQGGEEVELSDFQKKARALMAGGGNGLVALSGGGGGGGSTSSVPPSSVVAGGVGGNSNGGPNLTGFEEGGANGLHLTAYGHLKTIFTNLMRNPLEPRFRKLRVENPRLAKELFLSPAVRPLLFSLGFCCVDTTQAVQVAQAQVNCGGGTDKTSNNNNNENDTQHPAAAAAAPSVIHNEGEVFFLPMEVPIHTGMYQQVIDRLEGFKSRDEQEVAGQAQYDNQRKSLGMTVRRSLWVEAMTRKEIDIHVATELMRNPLGEVADILLVFRRVLTSIVENPESSELRTLKSSDPAIRSFIAAFGSLEFLCGRVGFQYGDNGLHLPFDRDADFIREKIFQVPDGWLVKLENTVKERVAAHKALEAKLAYEEATKQKRALQKEEDRMNNLARLKRGETIDRRPSTGGSGKRVPIAEALRYLMGGQEIEDEKVAHLQPTDQSGFDIRSVTQARQSNRNTSKVEELHDDEGETKQSSRRNN